MKRRLHEISLSPSRSRNTLPRHWVNESRERKILEIKKKKKKKQTNM